MSVDIVRPRVGDLIFQLYGRPLHPELFDILAHRKVQREDYELTLRITRTGHVITWENADVLLTEVAAADDQATARETPAAQLQAPRRAFLELRGRVRQTGIRS